MITKIQLKFLKILKDFLICTDAVLWKLYLNNENDLVENIEDKWKVEIWGMLIVVAEIMISVATATMIVRILFSTAIISSVLITHWNRVLSRVLWIVSETPRRLPMKWQGILCIPSWRKNLRKENLAIYFRVYLLMNLLCIQLVGSYIGLSGLTIRNKI